MDDRTGKNMSKRGRKKNAIEVEERVTFLLDLISKGVVGTSDLFHFFSEKHPDLTKRQFEYDLRKAKEKIKEYITAEQEDITADLIKRLYELYNKSLKIQDYRECRSIVKTIAEITGVEAAKKIDHSTKGEPITPTIIIGD